MSRSATDLVYLSHACFSALSALALFAVVLVILDDVLSRMYLFVFRSFSAIFLFAVADLYCFLAVMPVVSSKPFFTDLAAPVTAFEAFLFAEVIPRSILPTLFVVTLPLFVVLFRRLFPLFTTTVPFFAFRYTPY